MTLYVFVCFSVSLKATGSKAGVAYLRKLQEADDSLAGSPHKVLQFPSVGILLALGQNIEYKAFSDLMSLVIDRLAEILLMKAI